MKVRVPAFVQGAIVSPPAWASDIPYQPCWRPVSRSTLVKSVVMRFVPNGLLLAPVVGLTLRTVWIQAISSASTLVVSGSNHSSIGYSKLVPAVTSPCTIVPTRWETRP